MSKIVLKPFNDLTFAKLPSYKKSSGTASDEPSEQCLWTHTHTIRDFEVAHLLMSGDARGAPRQHESTLSLTTLESACFVRLSLDFDSGRSELRGIRGRRAGRTS